MRYVITGKNFEVTEPLRNISEEKISKLEKYFTSETTANITMSVVRKQHRIEVTIPLKGTVIRAEENAENMYAAIDLVVDKLERQLVKHRHKLIDRHRHSGSFRSAFLDAEPDLQEEEGPKIVRTKRFAVKPMDAEEACMELELLGHDFFVFRNADTEEVNVVYKRKNGDFGLIEPEA
ncbi:ribosome-associated translation inhibitor RaiA [Vallitaleaceae bacterium 9-2]